MYLYAQPTLADSTYYQGYGTTAGRKVQRGSNNSEVFC